MSQKSLGAHGFVPLKPPLSEPEWRKRGIITRRNPEPVVGLC
ncbi:hypothetical protein [Caldalkalibacillus salinus]|nr:hypothetical protein [Caldalkalibacillus salinus]